MSTILPLPSSPHCVPTTATVFISFSPEQRQILLRLSPRAPVELKFLMRKINSELEQRRRRNCRQRLELVEHGARHGRVHFENTERGSSHAIATELQPANIYSGLP